jgi:formiminoglutamase
VNFDAHLDLRPEINGLGHSGSPFRQALEHPSCRLFGWNYACLGAQPHSVSREHWSYARRHGCRVYWCSKIWRDPVKFLRRVLRRLLYDGCDAYLTLDADVVRSLDVPGVSAPNPVGLIGEDLMACARVAGQSSAVTSFDLVEINPRFDRDGQSARWAALVIWHFLVGLAQRRAAGTRAALKT